jgi:hypothetical protein
LSYLPVSSFFLDGYGFFDYWGLKGLDFLSPGLLVSVVTGLTDTHPTILRILVLVELFLALSGVTFLTVFGFHCVLSFVLRLTFDLSVVNHPPHLGLREPLGPPDGFEPVLRKFEP